MEANKKNSKLTAKNRARVIILILVLIVFSLLLTCMLYLKNKEGGTIIIRGKVVNDIPVDLNTKPGSVLVPLLPVLEELDYSITQQDDCVIISPKQGRQYELNLEDLSLYQIGGKNIDCLLVPPGTTGAYRARTGNDVVLDAVTFYWTLKLMDSGYKVRAFPKYKLVIVY